jgi:GTPase SAR1 family protein
MRSADGFVLVFDLTNRKTFDELPEFQKHITRCKDNPYPPLVLAANKCDCPESERKVSNSEIEQLATKWKVKHLDTSAKLRKNVDESFNGVVSAIMAQRKKPTAEEQKKKEKKGGCMLL